MGLMRGSYFYSLRKYLAIHDNPELYESVLEKLDDESKELMEGMVISTRMYSLEIYQRILDKFYETVGEEEFLAYNRKSAEGTLQGIFGLVARLISVDTLVNRMKKMWKTAFDHGTPSLKKREGNKISMLVKDFTFSFTHALGTTQYIARIIEIAEKCDVDFDFNMLDETTTELTFIMNK
jgi:hypothetical protein